MFLQLDACFVAQDGRPPVGSLEREHDKRMASGTSTTARAYDRVAEAYPVPGGRDLFGDCVRERRSCRLVAEAVALPQIETRFRTPENASPTWYSVACAAVRVSCATSNDERQKGCARQRAVARRPPRTTRFAAFSRYRRAACSTRLSLCVNTTACREANIQGVGRTFRSAISSGIRCRADL